MGLDDHVGQHVRQVAQAAHHRVLEPGQGRLRGQGPARDRIAVEQQLVDRIVGQPGGVVAVGVATGEPEDALPHQLQASCCTLPGCRVSTRQAARRLVSRKRVEAFSSTAPPSELAWGWSKAATTGLPLGSNPNVTCGIQSVAIEPPRVCVETSQHRFYSTSAGFGGCSLSSFTHNPG